jgi:hypothetical protein
MAPIAAAALVLALGPAQALEPPPVRAAQRVLGEVTAIDAAGRRINLKTDAGESIAVVADDQTAFLRAQPGARDLAGAAHIALGDIGAGDRVLARGRLSEDGRTLAARQVVVMSRTDIAQKQEQERAEWRRRGIAGVIKALDPTTGEITIEARSLMGAQTVVASTAERKAAFKRYAPGSVRFGDAVASSFAELQVGDQVRVLGDRAADGSRMTAEQVVSGAFQIVSGAVKAVGAGEVTIVDNETGKPLRVTVGADVMARRLPPDMAARLAMRSRLAAAGAGGNLGGRERRSAAPTLQDMLERLPPMPIEELKPGDQIAVSSPKAHEPGRITAAVLVAGIEPLLEAATRGPVGAGQSLGLAPGALDLGLGVP